MMTFIDDHMAVVGYTVVSDILANHALDEGNVDYPLEFAPSTTKTADGFLRKIKKSRKPINPLLHELLTMNEDKSIDASFGNQPGRQNRFSKSGRSRQDAGIMLE